jgi:hypothetical protein
LEKYYTAGGTAETQTAKNSIRAAKIKFPNYKLNFETECRNSLAEYRNHW